MRRITTLLLIASLSGCLGAGSGALRDSISRQLDNAQLGRHEIDIDVRQTSVTLNGFVGSDAARRTVEEIATNTEGVTSVHSNLTVVPSETLPQNALARQVWQNIRSRTDLEKYKIQVLGKGDQIQLSGETTSEQTRALIESVARATPGVTAVENAIIVRRS